MALFGKLVDGLVKKIAGTVTESTEETVDASNEKKEVRKQHPTTSDPAAKVSTPTQASCDPQDPLHNSTLDSILEQEKNFYKAYKEECIRAYLYSHYVDTAFDAFYSSSPAARNYELLDNLRQDLRDSDYFRQKFSELLDNHIATCANIFKERNGSTSLVYRLMREFKHFPEFAQFEMDELFVNEEYFSSELHAARSILDPAKSIKEQLDKILAAGIPDSIAAFVGIQQNIEHALTDRKIGDNELTDENVDQFLVFHHMLYQVTPKELDELKQLVLYLALEEERGIFNQGTYYLAGQLAYITFGITCALEGGGTQLYPGVDTILAEAIRKAKSGTLDEFNAVFEDWISTCVGYVDDDQFAIMQEVFNIIGAYSSERILLQTIIERSFPHSPEQEKRLAFLKENQSVLSQDLTKYAPVVEIAGDAACSDIKEGQMLVYDHRFLTWSTNEIEKYFKSLTLANKRHTVAAVVDKWAKTVTLGGSRWDNAQVADIVRETVKQEFDNGYTVIPVKAGVIVDDEIDSTPATYIRATENSRYPDISLLVVGEPMTKTQVHLSIFILAIPDDSADCNDKLLKRIVAVKEKHNPRLDTYVETFKSIITDRLNKWIIQINGTQDIY